MFGVRQTETKIFAIIVLPRLADVVQGKVIWRGVVEPDWSNFRASQFKPSNKHTDQINAAEKWRKKTRHSLQVVLNCWPRRIEREVCGWKCC